MSLPPKAAAELHDDTANKAIVLEGYGMAKTIDPKHNAAVMKAMEFIDSQVQAIDSHELATMHGKALGYIQCLFDQGVLPSAAVGSLVGQANKVHNSHAERSGWSGAANYS